MPLPGPEPAPPGPAPLTSGAPVISGGFLRYETGFLVLKNSSCPFACGNDQGPHSCPRLQNQVSVTVMLTGVALVEMGYDKELRV